MATLARRATVYFEPVMYRLLQHKALETDTSVSDLVNQAIRQLLAEDAEDMASFDERVAEPLVTYEALLQELKADGRI